MKTIFPAVLIVALPALFAPGADAQVNVGDVAIVGFWSDLSPAPRTFAFVVLKALDAGVQISFTDKGWLYAGGFYAGEGVIDYTVPPGGLGAGTVITLSGDDGGFVLSTSGDQVFVFQGSIDGAGNFTGTLLHGYQDNGTDWDYDATSTNTSALPPGLVNANVSMATERDNYVYSGPISGTPEALFAAINTRENWTGDDNAQPAFPTSFLVTPTAVEMPHIESVLNLAAFPNPFNSGTNITFELAEPVVVSLSIFDVSGRRVTTLLAGTTSPATSTTLHWDGRDDTGHPVGSGVYFCRLTVPGFMQTEKMALVK